MPVIQPPAIQASAPPGPPVSSFRHARIGMDVAGWRASAPQREAARCADAGRDVLVCRTPDQPLGGAYLVRELTQTFPHGRLAKLSFTTSVDGFAYVTAELKHDFGPPSAIVRDRVKLVDGLDLPHVLMTWRDGASTIRLSDPAAHGGRLRVTISSDAPLAAARSGA